MLKKRVFGTLVAALAITLAVPAGAVASPQSDYEEADAAATAASEAYDEACEKADAAAAEVESCKSQVERQQKILDESKAKASRAAVSAYKYGSDYDLVEMILGSRSLPEAISTIDAYSKILERQGEDIKEFERAKREMDSALAKAEAVKAEADVAKEAAEQAKEEANEARDAARAAYEQAQAQAASAPGYSGGAYASTSSSWNDEQSAKEYIIYRESRGDYSATNGRYYGAYQLDSSYLGGDYSPEHQDEVAEEYVMGRYGSWSAAAEYWDAHNWY